jgi:hypothetical protein
VLHQEVLGVDIGGVIIDRINDGTDTSFFSDNYLNTTAVPGAFDALRQLGASPRFGDKIFLVSKCGKRVQDKTLHWLNYHRFYDLTGIWSHNIHFCRKRREKAGVCERLGITIFIDDRLEVLSKLVTVDKLYLFQPRPEEVRQFEHFLHNVNLVHSWQEILKEELS